MELKILIHWFVEAGVEMLTLHWSWSIIYHGLGSNVLINKQIYQTFLGGLVLAPRDFDVFTFGP